VSKLELNRAGAAFFGVDASAEPVDDDWISLRDRWEYSHIARALLSTTALATLAAAMTAI
jgi:hypothetical protein